MLVSVTPGVGPASMPPAAPPPPLVPPPPADPAPPAVPPAAGAAAPGAAAAGGLAAPGGLRAVAAAAAAGRAAPARGLPSPGQSGIENIVMVLMENRSFDHFLGWAPGADGRQAGLSYRDATGKQHSTHHLTEWQGCGFNDPDHSYEGGRTQYAGGKLNGFRKGTNDDYALGYYTEADLVTTASLVHNFTICDRWFCSILGPTFPNRIYSHAAAT